MNETLNDRVIDLEVQLTHQNRTIEELSEMVARQWEMIDRMTRQVKHLQDSLVDLEDVIAPATNQKPPHY